MRAKRAAKVILSVFSITLIFIILGCLTAYFLITKDINLDADAIIAPSAKVVIYDGNGGVIEYSSSVLKHTDFPFISENIKKAFVALEDKRFYRHSGIDYYRLMGATVSNIKAGYFREGGSTITQQLAKNTLLSGEKTINRKLKEAKLAAQIEKRYDKDEILTMYLNAIYFGNGIYGITRASEEIFGKDPIDITLPEAAMLAGTVKNPRAYSPLFSPDKAEERKNLVLKVMLDNGFITEGEYDAALSYKYQPPQKSKNYYSYANAVLEEAAKLLDKNEKAVITGDYEIYTYQDQNIQAVINGLFKSGTCEAENADYLALVADNRTGGVLGYCSSFNGSVTGLRRQPGSAIKPLAVYAPALDSGYIAPSTPILDEKEDFYGYSPSNYADSYAGWTDVRNAILTSSNVAAVRIANEIGLDYCKYKAAQMGISFREEEGLSLALGGTADGVKVIDMAAGYMTLANYGKYKPVGFIKEIKTADGETVYRRKTVENEVFSRESSYLLTNMLIDNSKYGTSRKLASLPYQVASKTGTAGYASSDKNSDAWNLSYTTRHTVCVWYGNLSGAEETRMPKSVTGGSYPTILTKHIYLNLPPPADFYAPEGITEMEIDSYVLKNEHRLALASESTPGFYRKKALFDASNPPQSVSDYFDGVIPYDFGANLEDGSAIIRFTPKKGFIYEVYKEKNGSEQLLGVVENMSEYQTIVDNETAFGLTSYYLKARTFDGVDCGQSPKANVISFNLFL